MMSCRTPSAWASRIACSNLATVARSSSPRSTSLVVGPWVSTSMLNAAGAIGSTRRSRTIGIRVDELPRLGGDGAVADRHADAAPPSVAVSIEQDMHPGAVQERRRAQVHDDMSRAAAQAVVDHGAEHRCRGQVDLAVRADDRLVAVCSDAEAKGARA